MEIFPILTFCAVPIMSMFSRFGSCRLGAGRARRPLPGPAENRNLSWLKSKILKKHLLFSCIRFRPALRVGVPHGLPQVCHLNDSASANSTTSNISRSLSDIRASP